MQSRQYDLHYQPWTAIKGQVLADFVAEFTPTVAPPPPEQPEAGTEVWHEKPEKQVKEKDQTEQDPEE